MPRDIKVVSFVAMGLLLFGINQLLSSYGLKNLVLEIFPHYIKCHSNDCWKQKSHQINVWFWTVNRTFITFSKHFRAVWFV